MSNTSKRNHIKEGRLVIVAELYKRGWTIKKIAEEVRARMNTTCSTRTIWNDINTLLKEWRAARLADTDALVQLELERIDDCVAELWTQWEKSKEDYLKEFNNKVGVPAGKASGNDDDTEPSKIVTVRRSQSTENMVGLGNPAYMAEIRNQLGERRKLLGLYAAYKADVTTNGESIRPDPIVIEVIDNRDKVEKS